MFDIAKLSRDYKKFPLGSNENIPEQDLRYLYCESGLLKNEICDYLPCSTDKLYRLLKKYNIHKKVGCIDPQILTKIDWGRLNRNYLTEPLAYREKPTKRELEYLYVELELTRKEISQLFGRGNSERFAQKLITEYQIKLPKEKKAKHLFSSYTIKTGYSSPLSNPEVRAKATQTCREKYCVDNWMKTADAKQCQGITINNTASIEKAKVSREKTNLARYGVKHVAEIPAVKEKRKQTLLEKYNALSYPQSLVPEDTRAILNDPYAIIQLFMEYPNCNTETISKLLCVTPTTLLRYIHNYKLEYLITQSTSSFEREIKSLFPEVELRKDRTILEGKEIDLYAPDYKIGIEFNGNFWHSDAQKPVTYHKWKSEFAESKGVFLFHIFEYEWVIPERKQAIINHLKNRFQLNKEHIFARKCLIREVTSEEGAVFLDNNHIQGAAPTEIRLGLYYKDNLVALMAFNKHKLNKAHQWELVRFCCKAGTSVVGGASKLFTHFIKNYNPTSIVSYSDIAKTTGNLYAVLKFTHIRTTRPQYHWTDGNTTYTRYQCQLKQLIKRGWKQDNDNKSESQVMRERGFFKIYDCGKKVWSWVKH